ncbi:YgjV family protein [Candidatus Gottesmanbacteria bacterium]|nr:YgjV family protein [Candidatus Gottesmanbacteria bacterium]
MNIVIQVIGYIALLFVILSFQQKKRGVILLYLVIAQAIFALHFGLLNA